MLGPLLLPEALDERGVVAVAQPQVEHPQRHHPSHADLYGLVHRSPRPGPQVPLDLEAPMTSPRPSTTDSLGAEPPGASGTAQGEARTEAAGYRPLLSHERSSERSGR